MGGMTIVAGAGEPVLARERTLLGEAGPETRLRS
jgi:hypothetical protein